MAKRGSDEVAFLLIDGYDVLGVSTAITDKVGAVVEDELALGDTWPEPSFVGLKRAELSQEGFYDDASASINDALNEQEGVSRVLCYGPGGNTIGQPFTGYAGAMQAEFERIVSRGELHKCKAMYQGNGAVHEGVILHVLEAETAAGDTESTPVDNAASSADGGAGFLQVSALTLGGYTSLTAKVRHSADDITYADLITFTAVTAAPDAERKTVAGTVNRYLASSWAYAGAGSGPSATFMVGFARD